MRDARFDNDRLPPVVATSADMPFATAGRAMLSMTEAVTQADSEPLTFGVGQPTLPNPTKVFTRFNSHDYKMNI